MADLIVIGNPTGGFLICELASLLRFNLHDFGPGSCPVGVAQTQQSLGAYTGSVPYCAGLTSFPVITNCSTPRSKRSI